MKKVIRMGIIGCGGISGVHIDGINKSSDMEVTALCDILPDRFEIRRVQCGLSVDDCYLDYKDLLDSGKIDAVSICTPNNVHVEIALETVKRGFPYVIEKPVGNTVEEVVNLLNATKEKNIPNMVCFSYRFVSAARYAREIVRSGALGRLYHINCDYLQSWGLPNQTTREITPRYWRFSKDVAATGVIGDLGTHMFDMIRFMTGCEFTKISADYDTFIYERPMPDNPDETGIVDVDDYVNIVGQMEGPIAVNMSITRFAYSRGNYQRIEIYGEKGAVRFLNEDYSNGTLEVNMGNEPMETGHVWAVIPVPKRFDSYQMQSFADIYNGCGDGLAATIDDGYIAQKIVDKTIEAAKNTVII